MTSSPYFFLNIKMSTIFFLHHWVTVQTFLLLFLHRLFKITNSREDTFSWANCKHCQIFCSICQRLCWTDRLHFTTSWKRYKCADLSFIIDHLRDCSQSLGGGGADTQMGLKIFDLLGRAFKRNATDFPFQIEFSCLSMGVTHNFHSKWALNLFWGFKGTHVPT